MGNDCIAAPAFRRRGDSQVLTGRAVGTLFVTEYVTNSVLIGFEHSRAPRSLPADLDSKFTEHYWIVTW